MYTDRPFCLICKGVAGMQMLVLSSYVVDNAKANVGFNRKFLKLATSCCEKTVFVTSNYPEELLEGLPGLTVENLPYRWDSSQKKNLPRYFRMQCRAIGHIRRHHTKGMPVVFWLSGPMILPFLFCKLTGKKTVVFLYGNTRYKQDKPSLYASLISRIMRFMARHADKIGVETPSVLAQWSLPERCAGKVFDLHLYVDDSGADTVPYEQRGPVVGMACRLQGNKHPLEAIEAFHRLRGAFPDWTLEIAGTVRSTSAAGNGWLRWGKRTGSGCTVGSTIGRWPRITAGGGCCSFPQTMRGCLILSLKACAAAPPCSPRPWGESPT